MPQDDLRTFLSEQNSMIRTLGSFGGKPTRRDLVVNAGFFVIVLGCFILSLVSQEEFFQRLFLEAGILLISAKLAYFLWHFARIAHFQFWALVALETKLDILTGLSQDIKTWQDQQEESGHEKG